MNCTAGHSKVMDGSQPTTLGHVWTAKPRPNSRFVWNWRLIPLRLRSDRLERTQPDWFTPLYHGSVNQAALFACALPVCVTLIARRSRHFAGTRFLKRGTNLVGDVANEVSRAWVLPPRLPFPLCAPTLCVIITTLFCGYSLPPTYGLCCPGRDGADRPRHLLVVFHAATLPLLIVCADSRLGAAVLVAAIEQSRCRPTAAGVASKCRLRRSRNLMGGGETRMNIEN